MSKPKIQHYCLSNLPEFMLNQNLNQRKNMEPGGKCGIQPNPNRFDTQCLSHNKLMYCGHVINDQPHTETCWKAKPLFSINPHSWNKAPNKTGADSQYSGLSEKQNISSRGFFPYICGTNCISYPLAIISFPLHLAHICLKNAIHSCPSKSIQEHKLTSHKYSTDSVCTSQEEDVGPMLLFFASRKFLWFEFFVCVCLNYSK